MTDDEDKLVTGGQRHRPTNAALHKEPPAPGAEEQRRSLVSSIDELEGTLSYMGNSHPDRVPTQQRLEQLRRMLAALDGQSM